jgi:hypothetical protein
MYANESLEAQPYFLRTSEKSVQAVGSGLERLGVLIIASRLSPTFYAPRSYFAIWVLTTASTWRFDNCKQPAKHLF